LRREIKESWIAHPKLDWRSVIVVIPTFAEMDRLMRYSGHSSVLPAEPPIVVVNGVTDLVARDLGSQGVAIPGEQIHALGFHKFQVARTLKNVASDFAVGKRRPSSPAITETSKYADATARRKAYSNLKDAIAELTRPEDFPNLLWCLPAAAVYFRHSPETARAFSTSRRMVRFPNEFAAPCHEVTPAKGALTISALQNLVDFAVT
jgi:hypothetical protein